MSYNQRHTARIFNPRLCATRYDGEAMSPRVRRGKHQGYSPKNMKHEARATYLRFVVPDIGEDSQVELGVFSAVWNLRNAGNLDVHEEEAHDRIRKWFNDNLEIPTRFTASKPPYHNKRSKAISWFKNSAHEHIRRVRVLVAILQNHGIAVRILRTDRVGYVVYEDDYQIVAEPFAGEQY